MYLYNKVDDIDWFYDGLKDQTSMKQDPKYDELFKEPCVLLDNGEGKVYRYVPLQELAIQYGIIVGNDPQKDFDMMIKKMNGTFIDVYDILPLLVERANFSDTEAIEFRNIYPDWSVGVEYKKDWIIKYGDDIYRIGQDHTSQEQWMPGSEDTEALYSKIQITSEGYEVWKEWDGVSGAYAKDQIVQDPTDGNLYKSKIDSNVWGPPSTQPSFWELYVES